MLRLNDIQLPLNHSDEDLAAAIVAKLDINSSELVSFSVFKRSYDARKKANILLIYQYNLNSDRVTKWQSDKVNVNIKKNQFAPYFLF